MRHKRAFYATNVRTKGSLSPGPLVGYYFAVLIFCTKWFFRKKKKGQAKKVSFTWPDQVAGSLFKGGLRAS